MCFYPIKVAAPCQEGKQEVVVNFLKRGLKHKHYLRQGFQKEGLPAPDTNSRLMWIAYPERGAGEPCKGETGAP